RVDAALEHEPGERAIRRSRIEEGEAEGARGRLRHARLARSRGAVDRDHDGSRLLRRVLRAHRVCVLSWVWFLRAPATVTVRPPSMSTRAAPGPRRADAPPPGAPRSRRSRPVSR